MRLDAVVKVGGSLSRGAGLNALCREISHLSRQYRLLVVPGGGEFADRVRDACKRYSLNDTTAHYMALLAMNQHAYMLNQLIIDSGLIEEVDSVPKTVERGRTAILLPASLIMQTDPLPHSWQVTSDSIAAWVSQKANCGLLVLLKDVDGLLGFDKELIADMAVDELAAHTGGVDEYLAHFLASAQLETWIINGLYPERLSELLTSNQTIGTRIESNAE